MHQRKLISPLIILIIGLLLTLGQRVVSAAPSALFVAGLNGAPCGYTTIADAIASARPDVVNTIYILPGAYNEQLENITEDVIFAPANVGCKTEFTGANSDTVVIDASNQTSDGTGGVAHVLGTGDIFRPDPTYVTFRHMTLRDGTASNGGVLAATANGHITLEDVNVIGGSATNGGGIYASSSSVTLTDDSEVFDNSATNGGGVYGTGATVNLYDVAIGTSDISGNTASAAGGGVYVNNSTLHLTIQGFVRYNEVTAGDGGGIYSSNSSINFNLAQLEHNVADGRGGGIYLSGGALTVDGGAIRHNQAFEVAAGNNGGGIYAEGDVDLTIDQAQVTYNSAYRGGGLYLTNGVQFVAGNGTLINENDAFDNGGGIYAYDDGVSITVTTSAEISHNSAKNGGGLYTFVIDSISLSDMEIAQNSSTSESGGAFASSTVSILNNVIITGNTAGHAAGGASLHGSIATIKDSTISHNHVLTTSSSSGQGGGGIRINVQHAAITNTEIIHNSSVNRGGGLYRLNPYGELQIVDSVISFNETDAWGGGLFSEPGSKPIVISNTIVTNNSSTWAGGGLYFGTIPISLINSVVGFNDTGGHGAGIALVDADSFLIDNSIIRNNHSAIDGGGLLISCKGNPGVQRVVNSHIHNNSALNGGGIGVTRWSVLGSEFSCPIELQNLIIEDNGTLADGKGGGLYVQNGDVTMRGWPGSAENGGCDPATLAYDSYCSELRDNSAAIGGGAYVENTSQSSPVPVSLSIESTAILHNNATDAGSAIQMGGPPGSRSVRSGAPAAAVDLRSVYVRGNRSVPAIESYDGGTLTILSSSIVDNEHRPIHLDSNGVLNVGIYGTIMHGNVHGPIVEDTSTGFIGLVSSFNYIQPAGGGSLPIASYINNALDPGFITDPLRGPHRLPFNSVLTNANSSTSDAIDADLGARPAGNSADIGAFEYGADLFVPTAVGMSEQMTGYRSQAGVLVAFVLLGMVSWGFGRKHPPSLLKQKDTNS